MANRTFTLPVGIQKFYIFMVHITIQLAALNGKELMTEKTGNIVGQSCRGLF
jgi:hypothetical protein